MVSYDGQTKPTSATTLTVSGLEPGKSYTFQVQAKNELGLSEKSESLTLTTDPADPVDPTV